MNTAEAERARLVEQARIDASKTLAERRAMGQFATPPSLAREIAQATVPYLAGIGPVEMLEPAAGTGAFVSAFLGEPDCHVQNVTAIESDSDFYEAGCRLWGGSPCEYRNVDFTKAKPDRGYGLVVANPPYVRHHGIEAPEKKRLQELVHAETKLRISGLAGLYCHFLLLSLRWMKPGAVGVWLIPSEWMSVNYGTALRRLFSERIRLLRIHRFDASDVRFTDALVSSCVVWFSKDTPATDMLFTEGGNILQPIASRRILTASLRAASKWPPDPATVSGGEAFRLRDFFMVRRGIATGDNSFFVMSEEKAAGLNIPRKFLKPILPSPRHLQTDHVESDADGVPANVPRLFLLDVTGTDPSALPTAVREYLNSGADTTGKKKLCASRSPWYGQEQRQPAPILCTYMGRGKGTGAPVRFILNDSDAIATNSFLMLYPRGKLTRLLSSDITASKTAWRLLRAIPRDAFLRSGRSYGGGLQKMEPRELGNLDCSALGYWLSGLIPDLVAEKRPEQLLLAMEGPAPYDVQKTSRRKKRQ